MDDEMINRCVKAMMEVNKNTQGLKFSDLVKQMVIANIKAMRSLPVTEKMQNDMYAYKYLNGYNYMLDRILND